MVLKKIEKRAVSYPAYMLIEKQPCLVVGGGRVALRKSEKLISCGATVTVIATESISKLKTLAEKGKITLVERPFKITDIKESYRLVFATTDNAALNKKITDKCNEKRVLICAVDANWVNGAFITPASFSQDGLTVAVATGGRSCRRSKLIKENIYHHFTALELSELIVIGIDHSTLPLERQTPFHPTSEEQTLISEMLSGISAVHEFFILNTCNRFEIIALAHASKTAIATIIKLMGFDKLAPPSYYVKSSYEAFQHTSLMLSGVLSQNVGETYIVAQIKEALKQAKKNKWCDGIIQDWIDKSLHISKKIRNALLLSNSVEIDEKVVEFIAKFAEKPTRKTVAVLGSGKIGSAILNRLAKLKFKKLIIFYHSKRPDTSTLKNCEVRKLAKIADHLPEIDILISALNTQKEIITSDMIKKYASNNSLFIDLGTPPNIAKCADNKTVKILSLTDIQNSMNTLERQTIRKKAETLIEEHRELFDKIMDTLK